MAPLPSYAIVLSTYNGVPYLADQIESIRAQTAPEWRLYVRDDGSSDDTREQIARFAARDPRIVVLSDDVGHLGAPSSFATLLSHAYARGEAYIFLSDQDDVWLPNKAARMLAVATREETRVGAQVPLLVHSDLRVVSAGLELVHPSFFRYQRIDPHADAQPVRLLLRNAVTGCATLVNRALLERALPFPRVAMHDWWLAQCAALFGHIALVDHAMVLYRQHGTNVFGAKGVLGAVLQTLRTPASAARRFLIGLSQLRELRRRAAAAERRPPASLQRLLEELHDVLAADGTTALQRLRAVMRAGAGPSGLAARALLLAQIALLPWLRARYGHAAE
ncbi:MAG: glycosyltransferase family 2 protein [Gemmatimonadaceae bacterium]